MCAITFFLARSLSRADVTLRTRGVPGHCLLNQRSTSASKEGQELLVDLGLMRGSDSVWRTGVVDVLRALDEPGRLLGRILHRDDLVILAVDQEGRDVELCEVSGEVRLGEGLDGVVGILEAGPHAPEPELIEETLRDRRAGTVGAVEHRGKVQIVLRAILEETRPDAVEHLDREAFGIRLRFQHQRRDRSDQDRLRYPPRSMTSDVARDLPTAGGVADQCDLVEFERRD